MRLNIDITESINGWRVDLIDTRTGGVHKEDFETYTEVLTFVMKWVTKEAKDLTPKFSVY